jgi:DNA-binding NarL/FixJ family response regulator
LPSRPQASELPVLVLARDPEVTVPLSDPAPAGDAWCRPIVVLHPTCPEQIVNAFSSAPHLVLLDVGLLEQFGVEAALQLRQRHPAIDWMLGWQAPDPRWLEWIVRCQARGGIAWDQPRREILRAIEAVLAGEVWFSRATMQQLYVRLLDGQRPSPVGGEAADPLSQPAVHPPLTMREQEVMALMHQGLTNKQIAQRIGVSPNTVKKHLAHVFQKFGLHSRRQTLG